MIKFILPFLILFLLSSYTMACGGADEKIQLSKNKYLNAWALIDESKGYKMPYYYSDDYAIGNDQYNITNSAGEYTHQLSIIDEDTLEVLNYKSGEVKKYHYLARGVKLRGCNALKEIK